MNDEEPTVLECYKTIGFILPLMVALFLIITGASVLGYDIELNITQNSTNISVYNETTNTTINYTQYFTSYSLNPYELTVVQNTTRNIVINNYDNFTHTVAFDLIGINANIVWTDYELVNGSSKYGAVTFNQLGDGFFHPSSVKSIRTSLPIIFSE